MIKRKMKAKILGVSLIVVLLAVSLIAGLNQLQAYGAKSDRQRAAANDEVMDGHRGRGRGFANSVDEDPQGKRLGQGRHQAREARGTALLSENAEVTITATGTAYNISDTSKSVSVTVTLKAVSIKANRGNVMLNVTGGEVKIGSDVYSVVKGKALVNRHKFGIAAKAAVQDASGKTFHLVLKGKMTAPLSIPFNVGNSVPLVFTMPESKLAGQWFLSLTSSTLTRTG